MTSTAAETERRDDHPGTPTVPEQDTRGRGALLALATVAYLGAAGVLAVAPVPLFQRFALVQTFALFACGVLIVRPTGTPLIGWLLIVPGVTFNFIYDEVGGGDLSLPDETGGDVVAALLDVLPHLGILALALLVLVFPSGRPASRVARVAVWFAAVGHAAAFLLQFLVTSGLAGRSLSAETGTNLMTGVFTAAVLVGLVEQMRRYRRRPRVEQLQLKWFIFAIAGQFLYPAMIAAGIEAGTVAFAVFDNVATTLWPVTILIAISRYRLYDVDRLVSRTAAYAIVVVTLALLGIGGVLAVTSLLPAQDRLAVALATVGVVALFDPLRRRVVDVVDRRFDRTRYVARQVVEDFGRHVQDVTDVEEVTGRIQAVISRTVAPTTVAVWRPPDVSQGR